MAPPIVIATLQSASISLCSCVFAMLFSRTTPPVLAFLIFTFISTPPNFLWQQFLERRFPGYIVQKKLEADDDEKGVKKRLNIRNTVAKLLLDQLLGSFVNTVAFVGGVRLLRGDSLDGALIAVKEQTFPIMLAGYKLWPAFSVISFTLVPVERRTLLGSLVGFGWGVFLALRASN